MIVHYVLIIWIGAGNSQTLAIDHFDTEAECLAAKAAIEIVLDEGFAVNKQWNSCLQVKVESKE